jgi:dynein heavy chain
VHAEATKIAKETEDANVIAAQVAVELEKALPALQEAEAALNVLTKKDISELKVCCLACELIHCACEGPMCVIHSADGPEGTCPG